MYFCSTNSSMIVISRLIVGVTDGVGSSVLGMVTKAVEPEDRTRLLARIFTGRQAGVLFGPALNFILINFCFAFLKVKIDRFTAPGVSINTLGIVFKNYFCSNLFQLLL